MSWRVGAVCIQGVSNQFRRGVSRCHVYSFIIIGKTIRAPPIPFFSPAVGFLATGRLPAARLAVRCGGGRITEGSYKSPLMQKFMLILVSIFFLYVLILHKYFQSQFYIQLVNRPHSFLWLLVSLRPADRLPAALLAVRCGGGRSSARGHTNHL